MSRHTENKIALNLKGKFLNYLILKIENPTNFDYRKIIVWIQNKIDGNNSK